MATPMAEIRRQLRTRLEEYYALTPPGAPTISPQGTPGSASVTYVIVAVNDVGGKSVAGVAQTITTSAATLNSTDFNQLTWTAVPGAVAYEIYRTASDLTSPTTLGLAGSVLAAETYNDQGATALIGATPPTEDTSGLSNPFWTERELMELLIHGCKDLWRAIIDLHRGHFATIDTANVTLVAGATALTGVPADCFRVLDLEPVNTTVSGEDRYVRFWPAKYNSREFREARAQSGDAWGMDQIILYDILNAGSPVAAPSIVVGPPSTRTIALRLTYVPTLALTVSDAGTNPIPGESDNALIAWGMAYARAKAREDQAPDPSWLAVYATDKQALLTALTPRQEQESEVVDNLFPW